MSLTEFMITVFVLVDDSLQELFQGQTPWRQRGPQPTVSDSEILAMEVIGEFLGYDTDEGIYKYFLWHWLSLFPALARIGRTDFAKQATRLARVKQRLWRHLLLRVPHDPLVSIVDSFPLHVCQFARAKRCRRFFEEAAFGHDELLKQTFYGLRWHVRISWPGIITEVGLAPANISDVTMTPELLEGAAGWALADRNYWSPQLREGLRSQGLALLTPPKTRSIDDRFPHHWSKWLTRKRRRIETVIGQLVGRFHAKRTLARDIWHLLSRIWRKVLSHTIATFLTSQQGGQPLQFDKLITQ